MSNIYENYTPPSGNSGGEIYKPKDGEQVLMRVMSEPVIFDSTFQGQDDSKPQLKYAVVVHNFDAGEAQILVLPKRGFKGLLEYFQDPDYGDPLENAYDLKVKRSGTGTDTVWTITPAKNVSDMEQDDVDSAKAVDLIRVIENFPSNSNVEWLRDVVKNNGKRTQKSKQADSFGMDEVDQPINLDDIPFGNE